MKIGKYLLNKGYINEQQLNKALRKQSKESVFYNNFILLGKVLIDLGYIDVDILTEGLNKQNEHI